MKFNFGHPCQDIMDQLDLLTKDMLDEVQRTNEEAWIAILKGDTEENEES